MGKQINKFIRIISNMPSGVIGFSLGYILVTLIFTLNASLNIIAYNLNNNMLSLILNMLLIIIYGYYMIQAFYITSKWD